MLKKGQNDKQRSTKHYA